MSKKKTHEEYVTEVAEINPDIEVIEQYVNAHSKIKHKCKVCKHEWYAKPNGILSGYGCPKCSGVIKLTQEEYEERIIATGLNIRVIDKYINMNTNILHKCNICGYEWGIKPSDVVNKHGCPVCAGKIIGNPPEYKNSIWASEYKEYFSRYMTEGQMKLHMPNSNKKIQVKCPDCQRYKDISPNTLNKNGLGCICGDGVSYPNKFVYYMLKQLNIDVILEYSPLWSHRKQYDIFIPNLSCIIENHGAQHYKDGFGMFGVTYEEEKQNDDYKEEIAKTNGIKNYIVIDCRNSNKDWIKQSILKSELLSILGFLEYDIDWDECDMFATSNLVKVASELWNNGMCGEQSKMNLSKTTIYNYLKKGTKLLFCSYTGELSKKRTKEYERINKIKGGVINVISCL